MMAHMQTTPIPTPTPTPTPTAALPSAKKPAGRWGFLIPVVILLVGFGIPGFLFFWPEYQRSQLLETGVPAEATILGIAPTGNTFNDQPQVEIRLEVRPADGAAYEAETTMIVNPVYLSEFQPGKTVQVRYDAQDPSKVAIEETESGQR